MKRRGKKGRGSEEGNKGKGKKGKGMKGEGKARGKRKEREEGREKGVKWKRIGRKKNIPTLPGANTACSSPHRRGNRRVKA